MLLGLTIHFYIPLHIYIYIYICVCVCVYAHTHTYTHAHMCLILVRRSPVYLGLGSGAPVSWMWSSGKIQHHDFQVLLGLLLPFALKISLLLPVELVRPLCSCSPAKFRNLYQTAFNEDTFPSLQKPFLAGLQRLTAEAERSSNSRATLSHKHWT